jgi:hypothetical protein
LLGVRDSEIECRSWEFIVDSGSSDHMVSRADCMLSIQESPGCVLLADSKRIAVLKKGRLNVMAGIGSKRLY